MSLLMEALRKAEQDKRSQEKAAAATADAGAGERAPAAAAPPPGSTPEVTVEEFQLPADAGAGADAWQQEDEAPPPVVPHRETPAPPPAAPADGIAWEAAAASPDLELLDDRLPPPAPEPAPRPQAAEDALALPYELLDVDATAAGGEPGEGDAQEAIEALFDQAEEEELLNEFVRSRNTDTAPPPDRPVREEFVGTLTLDQSPAAAGNLFRAKQPARPWLPAWAWAGGGAVLLAAGALSAWLFWPRAPLTPLLASAPPPSAPVAPQPVTAPPAAPAPEPAPIVASASPPAPQEQAAADPQERLPSLQQLQAAARDAAVAAAPAATTAAPIATPAATPPPAAAAGGSIRIERGQPAAAPDSRLARAYSAAQAQRPDEAVRDWQRVLRERPQDPDALSGLAAVALAEGRTVEAQALYQRLLERDPQDVTAQAALVQLASMDPVQGESRIKLLLQQQPEAAHLHFALGNFYARQERWAEAQQAYFKAMSADRSQPDYLYNLAVSLDQLGQPRAAQGFYAQALEQAARRPAQFPRAAAQARLNELAASSTDSP